MSNPLEQEQITQAENMGGESTQGTESGEKVFTQEEVNHIVQERLARAKSQQVSKEDEARLADLAQREAELQQRELKLLVRDKLDEHGLPGELAAIITCEDEKDAVEKIEILKKHINAPGGKKKPLGFERIGTRPHEEEPTNPIRAAMGLE